MARVNVYLAYDVKGIKRDSLGHFKTIPRAIRESLSITQSDAKDKAIGLGYDDVVIRKTVIEEGWKY